MHHLLVDAHRLQRTIEYLVEGFLGNVRHLGLQVAVVLVQDGVNLPEDHLVLIFAQGYDGTFVNAQLAVGDDLVEVYLVDVSQSLTARTGTLR